MSGRGVVVVVVMIAVTDPIPQPPVDPARDNINKDFRDLCLFPNIVNSC